MITLIEVPKKSGGSFLRMKGYGVNAVPLKELAEIVTRGEVEIKGRGEHYLLSIIANKEKERPARRLNDLIKKQGAYVSLLAYAGYLEGQLCE